MTRKVPLRMPNRLGCSMLGCSVSKPESESSYCCDSHREMAASMDSSALGVPCIVFDGLKNYDVALCSSLLHRTVDGVAVGIPTISNDIFSVPPWELGAEFHTQLLPAEGCRDLVFFVEDPPEHYPLMGETSCSWDQKSYHKIELNEDTVTLIRNYLHAADGCIDKDLEEQCVIWELLRYSHNGVYLFCLSYNPSGSTLKRTYLPIKDRGVEVRPNTLSSALLKWKDLRGDWLQRLSL